MTIQRLGKLEQFTMSDVLGGKYYKAKAGKTEKELHRCHKTIFKGNEHVVGGTTRVLC